MGTKRTIKDRTKDQRKDQKVQLRSFKRREVECANSVSDRDRPFQRPLNFFSNSQKFWVAIRPSRPPGRSRPNLPISACNAICTRQTNQFHFRNVRGVLLTRFRTELYLRAFMFSNFLVSPLQTLATFNFFPHVKDS